MVLAVLAIGLTFMALDYNGTIETFGKEATDARYKYHKIFGILLLVLTILRLALRWRLPAPPDRPPLTGFERLAVGGVHVLLYVMLIGMPIGGWIATAAGGYPVQFSGMSLPGLVDKDKAPSETLFGLHGAAGLFLLFLIVLHLGAAIKHLLKKDGVMHRISLPRASAGACLRRAPYSGANRLWLWLMTALATDRGNAASGSLGSGCAVLPVGT